VPPQAESSRHRRRPIPEFPTTCGTEGACNISSASVTTRLSSASAPTPAQVSDFLISLAR